QLAGVEVALLHGGRRLRGRERDDVATSAPQLARPAPVSARVGPRSHAVGLGTEKPSSSTAGAFARTTSRGRHGRGTSGRSAFGTSTTCVVGGTPSRSSAEIFSMCSRIADSPPVLAVPPPSVQSTLPQ